MAAPELKTTETIEVVIDGARHDVAKAEGRTIIEVCDALGIVIPRFCYHPHLSVPANCRMCLVEVEGSLKLLPACHTPVRHGMVVHTKNDRVKRARQSILELLLVNHPVDCPICDQAGECPLQDQYFEHDTRPSVAGPPELKVKKDKAVRVGPRVVLDQERCVLCTRCTRFMAEIAKEPQLGMFWRNDRAYISTPPGGSLDSNYSLNAVAICPVGALTSSDFRFKKRVWELQSTPSLCDGCSRGCNSWIDHEDRRVYRVRARDNEYVNLSWMCDQGLLAYSYQNDERLLSVKIGRGAAGPASHSSVTALEEVAARLGAFVGESMKFALFISARVSTEDAAAAAWFVADVMKGKRVFLAGREPTKGDDILLREDKNPNRLGVLLSAKVHGLSVLPFEELLDGVKRGDITAVYGVGSDVPVSLRSAVDVLGSLDYLVLQATNPGQLLGVADAALPAATIAEHEGTFISCEGRLQRFFRAMEPRGDAAPHFEWLTELARSMGHSTRFMDERAWFEALRARTQVLDKIDWDSIGTDGLQITGIGDTDDLPRTRLTQRDPGVSRWAR